METITQIWKKIQAPEFNPATDMGLVEQVKQVALTSQESAKVSFGTSGWRGKSVLNLHFVTSRLWVPLLCASTAKLPRNFSRLLV